MDQQSILRQIASLQAEALSLRDALGRLPPDQRASVAGDLERLYRALNQLTKELNAGGDAGAAAAGLREGSQRELVSGADELVWTAVRTTRLYAINTALSVALTQAQVARVVVDQALPALGADGGVIMLLADTMVLKTIDAAGAWATMATGTVEADESSPFGQAARTSQSIWIETAEELDTRYDSRQGALWNDAAAMAVVPLIAEGRVLGVMGFRYDVPWSFTIADRAFLLVVAQQCAAALERVHLYEQVRQAAVLEERNRLARDLHDSVSQALYAIVLAVTVGRGNLSKDVSRVGRALENIESLAAAAQADLRALLFDLRADSIARTGLVEALLERAKFLRVRHGLAVQTELCNEPALAIPCKEALYGIAREAMHNAAKHARANQVDLRLVRTGEGLVLEIKDDGAGFTPQRTRSGHYGMHYMRERAHELGAELSIESAPGQGTRVVAVVPGVAVSIHGEGGPPCAERGGR